MSNGSRNRTCDDRSAKTVWPGTSLKEHAKVRVVSSRLRLSAGTVSTWYTSNNQRMSLWHVALQSTIQCSAFQKTSESHILADQDSWFNLRAPYLDLHLSTPESQGHAMCYYTSNIKTFVKTGESQTKGLILNILSSTWLFQRNSSPSLCHLRLVELLVDGIRGVQPKGTWLQLTQNRSLDELHPKSHRVPRTKDPKRNIKKSSKIQWSTAFDTQASPLEILGHCIRWKDTQHYWYDLMWTRRMWHFSSI